MNSQSTAERIWQLNIDTFNSSGGDLPTKEAIQEVLSEQQEPVGFIALNKWNHPVATVFRNRMSGEDYATVLKSHSLSRIEYLYNSPPVSKEKIDRMTLECLCCIAKVNDEITSARGSEILGVKIIEFDSLVKDWVNSHSEPLPDRTVDVVEDIKKYLVERIESYESMKIPNKPREVNKAYIKCYSWLLKLISENKVRDYLKENCVTKRVEE